MKNLLSIILFCFIHIDSINADSISGQLEGTVWTSENNDVLIEIEFLAGKKVIIKVDKESYKDVTYNFSDTIVGVSFDWESNNHLYFMNLVMGEFSELNGFFRKSEFEDLRGEIIREENIPVFLRLRKSASKSIIIKKLLSEEEKMLCSESQDKCEKECEVLKEHKPQHHCRGECKEKYDVCVDE